MLSVISIYALGLTILGLLTLLATVAVPFVSLRRERPRKGLAYSLRIVPLAFVRADVHERIQLSFDGRPVPLAVLVTLRVRNSGNTPILPNDFQGPLTVALADSLLDLRIDCTDPVELSPVTKVDAGTVTVEPLLLNPGDSFDLLFILDDASDRPNVSARIAGIRHLTEDRPSPRRRPFYAPPPRLALAILIFASIGYTTLAVGVLSLSKDLRREHIVVHLINGQVVCVSHMSHTKSWLPPRNDRQECDYRRSKRQAGYRQALLIGLSEARSPTAACANPSYQ